MLVFGLAKATVNWTRSQSVRFALAADGATAIEYALIAALVSVGIIGGVTYFGAQLNNSWLYLSNTVNPQLGH